MKPEDKRAKVERLRRACFILKDKLRLVTDELGKVEQQLKKAYGGRHVIPEGSCVCWCGSTHSWALSKHGWCQCRRTDCERAHQE